MYLPCIKTIFAGHFHFTFAHKLRPKLLQTIRSASHKPPRPPQKLHHLASFCLCIKAKTFPLTFFLQQNQRKVSSGTVLTMKTLPVFESAPIQSQHQEPMDLELFAKDGEPPLHPPYKSRNNNNTPGPGGEKSLKNTHGRSWHTATAPDERPHVFRIHLLERYLPIFPSHRTVFDLSLVPLVRFYGSRFLSLARRASTRGAVFDGFGARPGASGGCRREICVLVFLAFAFVACYDAGGGLHMYFGASS